ncbi:TPA: hypothetical protein ACF3XQ_004464 [Vibrio parahaemolyticus]
MKNLVLVIITLLSVGNVYAKEISSKEELSALKNEVRMLRKEIQKLELMIVKLSHSIDDNVLPGNQGNSWGCYLDDIKAGGVYGTGLTEAEAKGKALEKCNAKGGVCFTSSLSCIQSK